MDFLKQIQFYTNGKVISPRNLQCDFNNRSLVYNIELDSDFLNNNDGRFFFTAKFTTHVICDISLKNKTLTIACNPNDPCSHNVLFDGFSYTENNVERTKPIYLKSLQKIRELTNNPFEIRRAEEQKPEINVNVFKCFFPYGDKRMRMVDGNPSAHEDGSRALFVESLELDSMKKKVFHFIREKRIMTFKIIFNAKIVELAGDMTIRVI